MSGLVLVAAGCLAILKIRGCTSGPKFASCHIRQSSALGNCWWLSSVAALCGRNDLIRKICVAWDEKYGVYGFLFYRDGTWIHTVVDDRLYLKSVEYHDSEAATLTGEQSSEKAKLYQAAYQKGADSLFFAKSGTSNFTWLPLLEKAYAKVHGDYEALGGGNCAEGIEDLTGGVGDLAYTHSIQDQGRIWDSLRNMSKDHVYAISSPNQGEADQSDGVAVNHTFAVEKAFEFRFHSWIPSKVRLLKIRNPWGTRKGLWQGDWGLGSSKWGPLTMWWLQPRGHEDGVFYMTFEEAMKTFDVLYRLRLFDESKWTCRQLWVSMNASWIPQYNPVYFEISLQRGSEVAIALSQLDIRYFSTLQGRYVFHLEFLVKEKGAASGDFVAKSRSPVPDEVKAVRSVSIETQLREGSYEVWVKITAVERNDPGRAVWSAEDVVKQSLRRPRKLQQTALNYNAAYGKLKAMDDTIAGRSSRRSSFEDSPKVNPSPYEVAWNAVCGVGLRVFSQDPEMQLEVCNRDELKAEETQISDVWGNNSKINDYDGLGWGAGGGWGETNVSRSRKSSIGLWVDGCLEADSTKRVDSVVGDGGVEAGGLGEDAVGPSVAESVGDTDRSPTASSRRCSGYGWNTPDELDELDGLQREEGVSTTTYHERPDADDLEDEVKEAVAAEHFYQNGS